MTKQVTSALRAVRSSFDSRNRYHLVSGEIVCADALELLRILPDECADVVFLDPPFNLGKSYGRNGSKGDRLSDSAYLAYMLRVLIRSVAVLKPGGALYVYHLPKWSIKLAGVLADLLEFRHWIAISMKNGFARGNRLYPAHYSLLYFTKGEPRVFRRPKIAPLECPECHAYVRDYGGYERFIEKGVNLSDVWDDLSPVRHRKHKNRAANELPIEIARRAVRISGRPQGLLVDPFAGSGTALVAAREGGMLFAASDRERNQCATMFRRLLRTRPQATRGHGHGSKR